MIKQTKEYGVFKGILGNRQMSRTHLAQLRKEIEMKNLLPFCPIIVNENMEVIDGQHRLESAKALKLPISYVEVPGLSIVNVIRLNNSQRKWSLQDYVDLHIRHGSVHYIVLQQFVEQHAVPLNVAAIILGNSTYTTNKGNVFREGGFVVGNVEEAEEIVAAAKDLRKYMSTPSIYNTPSFFRALKKSLHTLREFDMDLGDLVSAYGLKGATITNYTTVREHMREFENVMNAGRPNSRLRLF